MISKKATEITNILLENVNHDRRKLAKAVTNLNKEDISILTKTITGKNNLNYHLYNIGYSYTQDCTYCSPLNI